MKEQYEKDGYVVVDSGCDDLTLDLAQGAEGPLQPKEYHWSDGPRVFEGWKTSQAVRDVAWAPGVIDALDQILEPGYRPFQTINFRKGTNQALHQDAIHFQTLPIGHMVGVWVALEDMDESNGPLVVVPGSHREGYYGWQDIGNRKCEVGGQYKQYERYENIMAINREKRYGATSVLAKRGEAIIWGPNLLHGGLPIKDESRTRFSQVTHYYGPQARVGWAPMFSDPHRLDYHFKSMRWFDKKGDQWEQHVEPVVTLYG